MEEEKLFEKKKMELNIGHLISDSPPLSKHNSVYESPSEKQLMEKYQHELNLSKNRIKLKQIEKLKRVRNKVKAIGRGNK